MKRKAVAAVEAALADVAEDGPGCGIGIVAGGETLVASARGLANLEQGVPITPASRFYLASVSKQVTALATLLAGQSVQLALDGSIRNVIPELPPYMDGVTLRHLLTHTGGVRDYFVLGFLSGFRNEHAYNEADVLELVGRQRGLNFTPGADFLYSNSGYVLLSIAIARATGKTLDGFAREAIFTPLGMDASRFQHNHTAVVPNKASGYEKRGDEWHVADSMLDVVGDGGMYGSLEDMLAWAKNLLAPRIGENAIGLMRTPAQLASGASTGYGMGLVVSAHRGLPILEHGGGLAGYRTHLLAYPSEGLAVVALCNDAAAWPARVARRVAERCLADRMAPAPALGPNPPARALKARAGLYRTAAGDVLALVEREGNLCLRSFPIPFRPLGADVFALDGDPDALRLHFRRRPAGFDLTQGRAPADRFVRCVPPKAIDEGALLGDFESAETGASGQVSRTESGLTVSFARGRPAALRAIAPDCLWAADLGATLTFERHGGAAHGFRLDGGRVRGITFSRSA